MVPPEIKVKPVVGSYYQSELIFRVSLAQHAKGTVSERWRWKREFECRCLETWIACSYRLHHLKTVKVIGRVRITLERIAAANHKPHLVQPAGLDHIVRNHGMPCVYRVETAAKYSYFHYSG